MPPLATICITHDAAVGSSLDIYYREALCEQTDLLGIKSPNARLSLLEDFLHQSSDAVSDFLELKKQQGAISGKNELDQVHLYSHH